MIYEFCESHGVPFKKIGKFIVATDAEQLGALAAIHSKAQLNGVTDVQRISAADAMAAEPNLYCTGVSVCPGKNMTRSASTYSPAPPRRSGLRVPV
jgi:L-2-hydroxyglutarate oxidase LhgO